MLNQPDADLQYLLWLTEVAALSPVKSIRLLEAFGSAKAVWQAELSRLERCVKLEARERQRLENRSLALPNQYLGRCDLHNVRILTIGQPEYPDRLRNIYDPPLVLYIRGRLPDFNALPAIAVVGQRKATPYGRLVAERLGFQLSCSGVVVVSGMAAGIDAAAHNGALKGPTPTVAVFGTAIDQCYPAYNAGLMRSILYSGAVVSEYPPGKKTWASDFPRRNRIISGLCLGVVVAEAPEKSGSLITAGLALDQGRDVFAVPGSVDSAASAGCNELIARGAKLVRSARDVLEDYIGLYPFRTVEEAGQPLTGPEQPEPVPAENAPAKKTPRPEPAPKAPPAPEPPPPTLETVWQQSRPQESDPVLAAMEGIVRLDELEKRTGLPPAALLARLTLLELKGQIRQLPGQAYERI